MWGCAPGLLPKHKKPFWEWPSPSIPSSRGFSHSSPLSWWEKSSKTWLRSILSNLRFILLPSEIATCERELRSLIYSSTYQSWRFLIDSIAQEPCLRYGFFTQISLYKAKLYITGNCGPPFQPLISQKTHSMARPIHHLKHFRKSFLLMLIFFHNPTPLGFLAHQPCASSQKFAAIIFLQWLFFFFMSHFTCTPNQTWPTISVPDCCSEAWAHIFRQLAGLGKSLSLKYFRAR